MVCVRAQFHHSVHFSSWVPVFADQEQRLGVMSIGFLLQQQDDAVVWRGPKKTGKPLRSSRRSYCHGSL